MSQDMQSDIDRQPDAAALQAEDAELVQQLALAMQSAELSEARRAALRQKIVQRTQAPAPAGTMTLRAHDENKIANWLAISPQIQMRVLRIDKAAGNQTILMRVAPGGVFPGHQHTQEEEFVVLEGECHIGAHRLCAGDVHIASAGSWHEDITTQGGVLVLVRGEYPPPGMMSGRSAGAR